MPEFQKGMTKAEKATRSELMLKLSEQNCPTYASLLGLMDLQIMPPDIQPNPWIAFMLPDKGIIVINSDYLYNPNNSIEQILFTIKHEILHEWRDHEKRLIKKLADESGIDLTNLSQEEFDKAIEELKNKLYSDDLFNVSADLEIYNVAADPVDQLLIKKIYIGNQVVSALSTDDTPRWKNWGDLSMEDMYDRLRDLKAKTIEGQFDPESGTFISQEIQNGEGVGVIYGK